MTLDETIKGLTEAARELGREVRAHRVAMEKERAGAAQPPASEVEEALRIVESESMPACPKCGTNHCVIESVVRPENGSHYCPARHEDSNIGHWFTPPPRDADAGVTTRCRISECILGAGHAGLHRNHAGWWFNDRTDPPHPSTALTSTDPETVGHATAKVDCSPVATTVNIKGGVYVGSRYNISTVHVTPPDPLAAVRELRRVAVQAWDVYCKHPRACEDVVMLHLTKAVEQVDALLPTLRLLPPGHVAVPREVAIDGRDACAKARDAATHSGVAVEWDRSVSAFNNALSKETP